MPFKGSNHLRTRSDHHRTFHTPYPRACRCFTIIAATFTATPSASVREDPSTGHNSSPSHVNLPSLVPSSLKRPESHPTHPCRLHGRPSLQAPRGLPPQSQHALPPNPDSPHRSAHAQTQSGPPPIPPTPAKRPHPKPAPPITQNRLGLFGEVSHALCILMSSIHFHGIQQGFSPPPCGPTERSATI